MQIHLLRRRLARATLLTACAAGAGLATAGGASAAGWAEIPSGTTDDITAIEYQSPTRFWFATSNGKVYRSVGGTFQLELNAPGVLFKDLEFQAAGPIGFAVGLDGNVFRSANGGDTWSAVPLPPGGSATSENDCSVAQPAGELDSIRFAGDARAWVTGAGTQIWRTKSTATATDVGSATAGWEWANDGTGTTCNLNRDIDDTFPVPGSNSIYFMGKSFGAVRFSSNALTGPAAVRSGTGGNGFTETRRLAGDPANPNRQWSVAPSGSGGSYYGLTSTGWNSSDGWTLNGTFDGSGGLTEAYDVDYNGGTVVAAGSAGMITNSVDGTTFGYTPAGGALATQSWLSVGLASATQAAVGGRLGVLVVSADANAVPTPPAVTTPPPTTTPPSTRPPVVTPPVTRLPSPTLAGKASPPLTGKAARIVGKYVVFKVKGKLGVPAGLSRKAACKGTMSISVYKGKKRLKNKTVKVSSKCGYKTTVKVKRTKVGRKTKKLKLKVAFRGNPVLGKLSSTYNVKVKK